MSGWGENSTQTNAVSYKVLDNSKTKGTGNLFTNTTPGAFVNNRVDGVYSCNSSEGLHSAGGGNNYVTHTGWIRVEQGTGPVTGLSINAVGGSYGNLSCGLITNGIVNAAFHVVVNSTGNATSIVLDSGGRGFINTTATGIVLPANGMVKANISVPGIAYTNSDFVTFSNGVVNAVATIGTNSIGAITSIVFNLGGGGFDGTASHAVPTITNNTAVNSISSALINAGGTGYANGDVATFSNGLVNAKATVATNSTGGISGLTMSVIGSGFNGAGNVVVTFANSTGGASSGTTANVVANTFNGLNGSIVANSTSFAGGTGLTVVVTLGGRAGRKRAETLVATGSIKGASVVALP